MLPILPRVQGASYQRYKADVKYQRKNGEVHVLCRSAVVEVSHFVAVKVEVNRDAVV